VATRVHVCSPNKGTVGVNDNVRQGSMLRAFAKRKESELGEEV